MQTQDPTEKGNHQVRFYFCFVFNFFRLTLLLDLFLEGSIFLSNCGQHKTRVQPVQPVTPVAPQITQFPRSRVVLAGRVA